MSKLKAMPANALSLPDIEGLVLRVAQLQSTRDQLIADILTKAREMDGKLNVIRAEFVPELERMDGSVSTLEKTISATIDQIEAWAKINPDLFARKRSIEMLCGTIGFRLTPPSVVVAKGWKAGMCALAMRKLAWARGYLKTPEIDRAGILRDRDKLKEDKLLKVGLSIKQEDEFYVEPKQEGTEALGGKAVA